MKLFVFVWIALFWSGSSGDQLSERLEDGDAPWVVSIMLQDSGSWSDMCMGALVAPGKVVTAAQCMDDWFNGNQNYQVRVGSSDRRGGQVLSVANVIRHNLYKQNTVNRADDIAVLTLASDAVLDGNVDVIPLNEKLTPKDGEECDLYAWPTAPAGEIDPMTAVDSMMPSIQTMPSRLLSPLSARVGSRIPSHFHKKTKITNSDNKATPILTSDSHFRSRRSTRGLGRRPHARFTTQKGPYPPEVIMTNGSQPLRNSQFRPLDSGTDCHVKFQQFPGHTACLLPAAGTQAVTMDAHTKTRIVELHNIYRAAVTPPATNMHQMRWDDELAQVAQRWADTCPDDHDTLNFIPGRFGVGQNLFWAWDSWGQEIPVDLEALEWAVEEWYIEHEDYDFSKAHWDQTQDWDKPTGHYTQMVWAETYLVGCAVSYCNPDKSEYVVVCNYGPQGNVMDQPQPYEAGAARCSECQVCVGGGLCDCGDKQCGPEKLSATTCGCEGWDTWYSSLNRPLSKSRNDVVSLAGPHNESRSTYWKIVNEGKKQVDRVVQNGQTQWSRITSEGHKQKSEIIREGKKQWLRLVSEGQKQYLRLIQEGQKQYARLVRRGKSAGLALVAEGMKQASVLVDEGRKSVWKLAEQAAMWENI